MPLDVPPRPPALAMVLAVPEVPPPVNDWIIGITIGRAAASMPILMNVATAALRTRCIVWSQLLPKPSAMSAAASPAKSTMRS